MRKRERWGSFRGWIGSELAVGAGPPNILSLTRVTAPKDSIPCMNPLAANLLCPRKSPPSKALNNTPNPIFQHFR